MDKKRGITLIALIITVIILLILAGTAISIAINGGDLFSKTATAREEWNSAVDNEYIAIRNILNETNDFLAEKVGIIVKHNDTNVDISTIPADEIADYYGDYVVNYTTGGIYQLYYVDTAGKYGEDDRIYIQNTSLIRRQF